LIFKGALLFSRFRFRLCILFHMLVSGHLLREQVEMAIGVDNCDVRILILLLAGGK
jgi:hypothetical protein